MLSKIKIRNSVATKAALIALATCVASPAAMAAVICNSLATPLTIPNNSNGVYINFVTGATGTSGAGVAGFDFNPWGNGGNLAFYMGADVDPNNGALVPVYTSVSAGSPIGAAQTFSGASSTTANMAAWTAGLVNAYMGVSFTNEGTGVINYGWLRMTTTAATGFPATINAFCYDNTGATINAGTTPVELQNFSVD